MNVGLCVLTAIVIEMIIFLIFYYFVGIYAFDYLKILVLSFSILMVITTIVLVCLFC